MTAGWRLLALTAALTGGVSAAGNPAYLAFGAAELEHGRRIWLDNCESCHGYGIAGAPVPMVAEDWRTRLQQDRTTLYRHAIDGFYGPDDTVMPARGGNDSLSDQQVRRAVDYMTRLAAYHIQLSVEKKQ